MRSTAPNKAKFKLQITPHISATVLRRTYSSPTDHVVVIPVRAIH